LENNGNKLVKPFYLFTHLQQSITKSNFDENGNAKVSSYNATGTSKPLSVYRHDPAFYSRHVAINQVLIPIVDHDSIGHLFV